MNVKLRLVATITSIVLTVGILTLIAIFAPSKKSVFISATIDFETANASAIVTGVVVGAKNHSFEEMSSQTLSNEETLEDWYVGNKIAFEDEQKMMTIVLTIFNTSESSIVISLTNNLYSEWNGENLEESNVTRLFQYYINQSGQSANLMTYEGQEITLESMQVLTLQCNLSVVEKTKAESLFESSFTVVLNAATDE